MSSTVLPQGALRFLLCSCLAVAGACTDSAGAGSDAGHSPPARDGSVCETADCGSQDAARPDHDAAVKDGSVGHDATAGDAGSDAATDAGPSTGSCQDGDVQSVACDDPTQTKRRSCAAGEWQDWGACEPNARDCSANQVDHRACGLNLRGEQQRICDQGVFGLWSECVDPDVCTDGNQDERTCGLNGHGKQTRGCSSGAWSSWSTCVDADVCQSDQTEQRACGFNLRGTQKRTCVGGGFSDWSACSDVDVCRDDALDAEACGLNGNGTHTRICRQGQWSNFGVCTDEDECHEGDHTEQACGLNQHGSQVRDCTHGRWSAWSMCRDGDECTNDDSESRSCGYNLRGKQARSCVNGHWGEFSACADPDQCKSGSKTTQACGRNQRGVATSSCVDGAWQPFAACVDPDECSDGAQDQQACGLNGRGHSLRDCQLGKWTVWSSCDDRDTCVDKDVEQRACGFNGRGSEQRDCEGGQWGNFQGCSDPDQCHDHDLNVQQCGLNGRGTRSQTCSGGQWQPADCVDQDECHDQEKQQASCGVKNGGVTSRACQAGHWLPWAACSVQCGNGVLETGEECDDKNGKGGDGCSADCRVEHVEWIYQIPGVFDSSWRDTVHKNGTFAVWLDDQQWDVNKPPSPRVVAIDSKGKPAWTRDFGVTQARSFSSTAMGAGPDGETILYGRFTGKSSMIGDSPTNETIFLSVLDKTGWDIVEARLQHQPSGTEPAQIGVVTTPNGDLSTFGRFAVPEYLRMYNSVVTSWAPQEFYWLRLHASDLTPRMTASFSVSGDRPSVWAFAADDTRQVVVLNGGSDATYRFEDGSSIEQTASLILGVDNQGKRILSYAFPSKCLLGQPKITLLANGETLVSVPVFPDNDNGIITDPTGDQPVTRWASYTLWFGADGALKLIRPGVALGVHDGKLLLRNHFVSSIELESGRPWARTLTGENGKPGQYLAAYTSDGTLADAAVLFTRTQDPAQDDYYELHDDWILVQALCSEGLRMGMSDPSTLDLVNDRGGYCLARFDTSGALDWATSFGDSYDSTLNRTVVQGNDIWILRWGRDVSRFDEHGQLTLDLPVTNARSIVASDQGIWVRASMGPYSYGSVVGGDPLDRAIDGTQGSQVVIKVRR